jgi:hypothetical protein
MCCDRIKLLTEVLNGIKVGLGFFYICVKIFYRQMFFHWTPSQVHQTIYTAAAVNIYHSNTRTPNPENIDGPTASYRKYKQTPICSGEDQTAQK